ncbi:transporter [Legionella sp. WA2024007413]
MSGLYKLTRFSLFLTIIFSCQQILAKDIISPQAENEPPNIGNFALPPSQQPGPFLSFGQSLIEKGQMQFYVAPNYLKSRSEHFLSTPISFVYGLSDKASLLLSLPIAASYVSDNHSSGIGDIYIQGEYAPYDNSTSKYAEQLTVVGGLSAPSGSFRKDPPTGFGAPSYFLGSTYNRMSVDWLWFAASGLTWIEKNGEVKLGTQYLYQSGLGRNIKSVTGKYIFFSLVEVHGVHMDKDKVSGEADPDTGGDLLLITPSLWFSTKKFFFQLGWSTPIYQALNGEQSKINYHINGVLGVTFN